MRCEDSRWFGTVCLGSRLMPGIIGHCTLPTISSDPTAGSRCDITSSTWDTRVRARPWHRCSIPVSSRPFLNYIFSRDHFWNLDNIPIGIATAVRGNVRFPDARCIGAYGHSAALPRRFRQDAVLAVAELALALDGFWKDRIAQGDEDFVFTVGKFSTDAAQHAMTKVAGEVKFSLNIGAAIKASQDAARTVLFDLIEGIEKDRELIFELGREVGTTPTQLDGPLIELLEDTASALGIATCRMPTVGHDAAMFARAGIPSAVILVRNANGSHNSDEALERQDFAGGVHVLGRAMHRLANAQ